MTEEFLKLTSYFGERDRVGDAFLADALTDIFTAHELRMSLVIRGIGGFGLKHHLRTDRLLTLSEDLPLVSVAVDTRARIEAALAPVTELRFHGLVTLERAVMVTAEDPKALTGWDRRWSTKLTVYVGRHQRVGQTPAYEAAVSLLHDRGVAGATVLLGVDGTLQGARQRARFIGRNTMVPLMIVSVGERSTIRAALPELRALLPGSPMTLERVRILKRDGALEGEPDEFPETDPSGLSIWQKLMVHTAEDARYEREPLHDRLIRELRGAGASGATALRGIWGYRGDYPPHGDSLWQLRRRVPVVTVIVDTPTRIRRWFRIVDRLTQETGLVTSELVPAFRATGPELERGGLRLAHRS